MFANFALSKEKNTAKYDSTNLTINTQVKIPSLVHPEYFEEPAQN